ncbi:phosphate/phosphite/phosphonate ABC transporter substrate-binding protein [Pseudoruegeria sp. SHC-113]|uniref:phosphate/phosphite/phosphonate ABC transporter substrate-binding protein n=1 Tax=Pseudoruegeria sp. SHC-113 TaxID=2855439 RepID=UPI0021BBB010|nr:phosphate/phosphite/phosphonate ABC transporter substrate-binding protein [Pseudoruegeria sp. SHC-113]MCT8159794.1 phosphate/phosphite/phosphonate ABC transporter substrate-binding protein [Pseudoruegeria sp. SHC-113]
MIAALPMYDRPEVAVLNDRFWHTIRASLGHGPQSLTRGVPLMALWEDRALLLAQTCGLPYRARLHGRVTLVGTPDYGVDGCPPGFYRSHLLVRADDPRQSLAGFENARLAINEPLSQSGWAAPQAHFAKAGIPIGSVVQTGSHAGSALAVAEGRADIAAVDAVTWRLICAHDGFADRLRVLDSTAPTPGLPYITAQADEADSLFEALTAAIAAPENKALAPILPRGLLRIAPESYTALQIPPPPPADRRN